MLRGAEDLVDSLVAVFTDVGEAFKRSKNFANHIFYWLRLSRNEVVVKGENFAITVRNNFGREETVFVALFVHTIKCSLQAFFVVRKNRKAQAGCGFKNQFVFHGDTLAVCDDLSKNFLCLFNIFFVEVVQSPPVRLVIHQLVDSTLCALERDLESHDVVDVHLNFHFHAYRLQGKVAVVNRFF